MNIVAASENDINSALELLQANNLPTGDLSDNTSLFVLTENEKVLGTVGMEFNSRDGLLRSLSVSEEKRSAGLGRQLVEHIESFAVAKGIRNIYLLTTTARDFFSRIGYEVIDRSEASDFIKSTSEFSSVCPASATFMKKSL